MNRQRAIEEAHVFIAIAAITFTPLCALKIIGVLGFSGMPWWMVALGSFFMQVVYWALYFMGAI